MTNSNVVTHRPPSRPLGPDHRDRARARHRSGPDPRAVGRRGRHQGRQPVLHGRHGQGRCDPRQPQEPHRQGRGPAEAAPGAAGIHHRDLGRHPQRHARNALLADRARGDPRCAVRASERHGPRRHHRGRRLRQAAGRHAGRAARAQSARDHHVGRRDPSRHRSRRPARSSTSSAPIRSPAIPTPNTATTSPAMPAPATAAAAACSPTTPCRPSSASSACSRCTWWRRRPTIRAASRNSRTSWSSYLAQMIAKGLKPRDIVVRDSIRNAVIVAMAIGGSTNVTLHAPEIARAAGFADFWKDVMTPAEFNHLSQYVVPVLTDARPYGKYSMVDIDAGRRRAGDRARTAGGRAAQRRRDDLHRRNAGRSRSSASAPSPPTARWSIPSPSPTSRPAACACSAATCRRNSPRS